MAINKSKVAVGFIVAGSLTLIFGAISVIVGPTVISSQVVKVSIIVIILQSFIIRVFFLFPVPF